MTRVSQNATRSPLGRLEAVLLAKMGTRITFSMEDACQTLSLYQNIRSDQIGDPGVHTFLSQAACSGVEVRAWLTLPEEDGYRPNEKNVDIFIEKALQTRRQHSHAKKPGPSGKAGRNAPCPCGSGLKFKRCCGRQTRTAQ